VSFFDAAYRGTPPWDIGRPQPAVVRLEAAREFAGDVLDAGCGTGENAYFLAEKGHPTWGVDLSATAIDLARGKVAAHSGPVRFRVGSALALSREPDRFDSILDCGLFHTFSDDERARYVAELRAVLRARGRYFVLCFSEREPADWGGPRRVRAEELERAFADGWRKRWIRPERFETRWPEVQGHAWLGSFERAP
jgi:SAM-dependent methyltransferase